MKPPSLEDGLEGTEPFFAVISLGGASSHRGLITEPFTFYNSDFKKIVQKGKSIKYLPQIYQKLE